MMDLATAAESLQSWVRRPESAFIFEMPAPPMPGQVEEFVRLPSDEASVRITGPSVIPATWLPKVERRIRDSVDTNVGHLVQDGSWLDAAVAARALVFFQNLSDVLPGEPYVYSSLGGDLVAEFRGQFGTMTAVVGRTFALARILIAGDITEGLELHDDHIADAREQMRNLTNYLKKGSHGAVESA